VTDHAEYLGVFPQLSDPNSELSKKLKDNPLVKMILSGDEKKGDAAFAKLAVTLTENKPDPDLRCMPLPAIVLLRALGCLVSGAPAAAGPTPRIWAYSSVSRIH